MNPDIFSHFNRQSLQPTCSPNPCTLNYEKDLKVDKRILEIMRSGGNQIFPSISEFFGSIIDQTQVVIDFSSTFKDRQGNEIPIVKVLSNNIKNLEAASALIMEYLDPHRDKMTFNIDVPYNDHSYIIGKDGSRIKQLSRETGCHIHLPDCNKTSGKKSNKLSIAGTSFESIEQARNQIRKSLPLNIGFKASIKSKKFVHIDTSSSEVQAIKRKYRVDVTFTNVVAGNKSTDVTINVKGGRSQLDEIKSATQELYQFVTGDEISNNPSIDFTISIDISHSHHQYVKGKNNCNLKVIHQRSKALISFPPNDIEINQVIIQGKDLISTVMGWQELMGYLPLLLSFDVNFDISKMQSDIHELEKHHGVGIRTREKLCGHVYTILIKTQERHSICLQEIRQRILQLKTKADKMSDDNLTKENFYYANMNAFDNYVQMKTSYLANANNNFSKSFNPNYFNYHAFPKVDIDQISYPMKLQRLSIHPMDNISLVESYHPLASHYNKHKGLSKHSPVNEHNYFSFFQNQFGNDPLNEEVPSCNNNKCLNSLTPISTSSSKSFDASTDKNSMLPLKPINFEMNNSYLKDNFLPPHQTTIPKSRFSSNESAKVDYSFSRFSYQNFGENDSGIGSIIQPMSPTICSASSLNDSLVSKENSFSSPFNFFAKPFSPKLQIPQSNR